MLFFVMPAEAGIQKKLKRLDSRLRGNDNRWHTHDKIKFWERTSVNGVSLGKNRSHEAGPPVFDASLP
jgi:hypothetical protein